MTPVGKARFVNALTFARVPLIFAWLVLAVVQELMPDGARVAPDGDGIARFDTVRGAEYQLVF